MRLRQLFEATNDSIAFCFGRMNPPTIGHGQVFDTLAKTNKNYRIFISPAQTPKKDNPLDFATKIKFIKAMFPQHAGRVSDDASLNTIMKIAVTLYNEGYKNITVVAGSDRLESFSKLLNDYNGVESAHGMYKFDNIDLVSSGDRDPDADGLEGISASAARAAAREGDLEKFSQVTGAGNLSEELYKAVRAGLNIKEEAAGVGIVTKQNATVDVPVGGEYMNVKKLFPKKKKVKEQGVAEVSKATIDRYVAKASDAHGDADFKARMSKHDPDKRSYHVDQKKTAEKRRQGISRALDRMSRQDDVSEAPIEMDPSDPMDPMIVGHDKANPAKLKYRMLRAANQLKDLASRAATASPSEWQTMTKQFDELKMNMEQIRHALDELAKQRRKGGIRSRGIDPHIG